MVFEVIHNPNFVQPSGFSRDQFRKLDQLYSLCASKKILNYRTVECDFDQGIASYTYYKSSSQAPLFQFLIRRVGPSSTMFEVYKHAKGRVVKSSLFDRAFERLYEEVDKLLCDED